MKRINTNLEEIVWNRIYLNLKISIHDYCIENDTQIYFYLIDDDKKVITEFLLKDNQDNIYSINLNITNSGINRCINNGIYEIFVTDEENFWSIVEFAGEEKYLEQSNKCLRYLKNVGAYTVTFMINENTNTPVLELLFFNMNKKALGNMGDSEKIKNSFCTKLVKKIVKFIKSNKRKIAKRIYLIIRKYFKRNSASNLLFLSEQDNKLANNMQTLLDKIYQRNLNKCFNINFSLRKKTSEKVSLYSSIRMLYLIAMADIILVDDHIPIFDWLLLKEDTKVIQIWHAGAGFKGVGYSRWGHDGSPGPFSCHRQYTYCISGSEKISHFFSEQFGILEEQIIPTGMPRMDNYLDKDHIKNIKEKLYKDYPFLENRNIVLFAPTYRGQNRKNAYYPYEKIDFESLFNYCQRTNSIVLFKMHPWVQESVPIKEKYSNYFYDFNSYPDINNLFYITDLLITDYSSSMYEYALMYKPMLAYAFDKVQYASTRGFHRAYDENVPGKVCESFNELIKSMYNMDYQYNKHNEYMDKHYDYVDTNNSDRVIDWLILDKLPEIYRDRLEIKKNRIKQIRSKSFEYLFMKDDEE